MSAFQFFPSMNQDVSDRLPAAAVRSAHREKTDHTSELDMSRYYDIYSSGSPLEATPSKTTREVSCITGKVGEFYYHSFPHTLVEDEYQHPSDNKNIVSWGDHDITQNSYIFGILSAQVWSKKITVIHRGFVPVSRSLEARRASHFGDTGVAAGEDDEVIS